MDNELHRLLPLFERARARDEPLALATVLRTAGSTYRKQGAVMLFARDGEQAGLLSGGCLETDLAAHASKVIETGHAALLSYDMRGPDDQIWGLGSGCEGAMDVLLVRVGEDEDWRPFADIVTALAEDRPTAFAALRSRDSDSGVKGLVFGERGAPASLHAQFAVALADGAVREYVLGGAEATSALIVPVRPPPHVLLLGGGPDAVPVADLARFLGWHVTVVDHRSAYATAAKFPQGTHVCECAAGDLGEAVDLARIDAAVVMSHHLDSDLAYLRTLARAAVPYVGLLGPAARREKLLRDLGAEAALLRGGAAPRLRAPVGLDVGAGTPVTIALAIVAEIQAYLTGRAGGSLSDR